MPHKPTIELTLFDNEKNREKSKSLSPFEIMCDDEDNQGSQKFFIELEDYLKWGKKYRVTVEEVGSEVVTCSNNIMKLKRLRKSLTGVGEGVIKGA